MMFDPAHPGKMENLDGSTTLSIQTGYSRHILCGPVFGKPLGSNIQTLVVKGSVLVCMEKVNQT